MIKKVFDWLFLSADIRELDRLNKLWERFNEGEDVRDELDKYNWNYHKEKANYLREWHKVWDRFKELE